jgi:hypothetical protein
MIGCSRSTGCYPASAPRSWSSRCRMPPSSTPRSATPTRSAAGSAGPTAERGMPRSTSPRPRPKWDSTSPCNWPRLPGRFQCGIPRSPPREWRLPPLARSRELRGVTGVRGAVARTGLPRRGVPECSRRRWNVRGVLPASPRHQRQARQDLQVHVGWRAGARGHAGAVVGLRPRHPRLARTLSSGLHSVGACAGACQGFFCVSRKS